MSGDYLAARIFMSSDSWELISPYFHLDEWHAAKVASRAQVPEVAQRLAGWF